MKRKILNEKERKCISEEVPKNSLTKLNQGRSAEIYLWEDNNVLKLFYSNYPEEMIHHEFRVAKIVEEAGIPCPKVEREIRYQTRLGIIYERIEGSSLLQILGSRPSSFLRQAQLFADLHLSIHRSEARELPSQRDLMEKSIQKSPLLSVEIKLNVLSYLKDLPDANAICHGDFQPSNIIMSSSGPKFIDWGGATRGNPVADVMASSLLISVISPPNETNYLLSKLFIMLQGKYSRIYKRRYFKNSPCSQKEIKKWTSAVAAAYIDKGFIPEEQEKVLKIIQTHLS